MSLSIPHTVGALLGGGIAAVALSALIGFQTWLYFRIFPADTTAYKLLVGWIWLLDTTHTTVVCTVLWQYIIIHFAHPEFIGTLPPAVGTNIVLASTIACTANAFYAARIHQLSRRNWAITSLLIFLVAGRYALALVTSVNLFEADSVEDFLGGKGKFILTAALILSALSEIATSLARFYYLHKIRSGYTMSHETVDTVMFFTVNDGILQILAILAALICFVTLEGTFIFMGIIFTLPKCASNSVLATLNLRNWYRHQHVEQNPIGVQLQVRKTRDRGRDHRSAFYGGSVPGGRDQKQQFGGDADSMQMPALPVISISERVVTYDHDEPKRSNSNTNTIEEYMEHREQMAARAGVPMAM